jgi:hypothetical protein
MAPTRATGSFAIESWDGSPYDDRDGTVLSRARLDKRFTGDLEATSTIEMLAAEVGGEPTAYVGLERVAGRLAGREGTFVLHHTATSDADGQRQEVTVVSGSGSGGLAGLRGRWENSHGPDGSSTYAFDYELD